MDSWIDVKKKIPNTYEVVLTYGRKGSIGIGYVTETSVTEDGVIFYARYGDSLPTHWMPLPSPPQKKGV